MKPNPTQKNGPVTHIRPGPMLRDYLDSEEADWLEVILISPTKAIICNSRKHRTHLIRQPRILKQLRGR